MTTSMAGAAAAAAAAPLTAEQKAALANLHKAATQFEGVFLGMMMKTMRETAPPVSITGQPSNAEQMFTEMLDQQRADAMAQGGSLGIARMMEQQLRASVLAGANHESKSVVPEAGVSL